MTRHAQYESPCCRAFLSRPVSSFPVDPHRDSFTPFLRRETTRTYLYDNITQYRPTVNFSGRFYALNTIIYTSVCLQYSCVNSFVVFRLELPGAVGYEKKNFFLVHQPRASIIMYGKATKCYSKFYLKNIFLFIYIILYSLKYTYKMMHFYFLQPPSTTEVCFEIKLF